ncbi:MAG: DUF6524 family protein [Pseudomonadota bacterium]
MAGKTLSFSDIAQRCIAAIALVLATYNPSGYSYLHWVAGGFEEDLPLKVLGGVALAILFIIFLRATLRSIGVVGIVLIAALLAALAWTLVYYGIVSLSLQDRGIIQWLALLALGLTLGIGLSWSIVRRVLTGQTDVDDVDA